MKIIIFDTETTGFNPGNIAQLAYCIINTETFEIIGKNFFFTVPFMSESAEKIHGYSLEKLAKLSNGKVFADNADEIYNDFADCQYIVAHNINYDAKFMSKELRMSLHKGFNFGQRFIDTCNEFKNVCKIPPTAKQLACGFTDYKNPKLDEVVQYYNISLCEQDYIVKRIFGNSEVIGYHDARFDVALTTCCLLYGIEHDIIPTVLCTEDMWEFIMMENSLYNYYIEEMEE